MISLCKAEHFGQVSAVLLQLKGELLDNKTFCICCYHVVDRQKAPSNLPPVTKAVWVFMDLSSHKPADTKGLVWDITAETGTSS